MDAGAPFAVQERRFPPELTSVAAARAFVGQALNELRLPMVDDAVLVVSELVSNAVLHAGTELTVRVRPRGDNGVRLEIADRSSTQPVMAPAMPPVDDQGLSDLDLLDALLAGEAMTGRGLRVVDSIASRWGVDTDAMGKTVWAEIGGDGAAVPVGAIGPADAAAAVPLAGDLRPIRLVAVPVRLAMESDQQLDDLVRELQVLTMSDSAPAAVRPTLAADLDQVLDRHWSRHRGTREAVAGAAARGERLVDLTLGLPPRGDRDLLRLVALLEEAGELARDGVLLALPPGAELMAFRRWYAGEVERQLGGAAPSPCPFPVIAPAPVEAEGVATVRSERRARLTAERAAAQLASLQAVTASLAGALTSAEVAEAVLDGLVRIGASTGSFCLVQPDGEMVDIVHHVGYPVDVQTHWRAFHVTDDVPASEAIRTGASIFLRTAAERDLRYPIFQATPVVGDEAVAVLPLRAAGKTLGALVVGFERARDFTADDERFLDSLASQAAQALDRAHLHDAAAAAADRLAFLADAATVLNASLDLATTLRNLASLAVPRLGDWCSVHLTGDDGAPRFVVAAHRNPERQALAEELLTRWPVDPTTSAIGKALRDGTTTISQVVSDEMLVHVAVDDDHLRALRVLSSGAGLVVPITAWGRVAGALALANEPGRPVTEDEHALARDLAARAGAAIANAQLYADRVHVARELQATLLPTSLPVTEGIEFGAHYAAAGGGAEVGGDFYDVIAIEGGWLLAIGDVRGKGVEAAAVTGVARHTIRALAPEHDEPAELLRRLNQVLLAGDLTDPEPRFCTVALVRVTPTADGAAAVICTAGHPPPLVLRTEGSVEVCAGTGSLLGVLDAPYLEETHVALHAGDSLLLYTDGIIERHQGHRFFEEAGLAAALARVPRGATAKMIVEAVHDAALDFVEGELGDDMAVLAVRVAP